MNIKILQTAWEGAYFCLHAALSCRYQQKETCLQTLYSYSNLVLYCRVQTVRTKEEKEVLEHFAGVVSKVALVDE